MNRPSEQNEIQYPLWARCMACFMGLLCFPSVIVVVWAGAESSWPLIVAAFVLSKYALSALTGNHMKDNGLPAAIAKHMYREKKAIG